MWPLRPALVIALACLLPGGLAGAAEITRVEGAEPDDPLAVQLSVRWDRSVERARISRERAGPDGTVRDATELRWSRTRNDVIPRLGIGLAPGLELHAELPWSLADDVTWRYGTRGGFSVEGDSTIANNVVDAMGRRCDVTPCPLFPVSEDGGVFHGGRAGDLEVGLAWAILDDRRDEARPTWVVGLDLTLPTADRYDPARGRDADWGSPYASDGHRGPAGEKVWKWDLSTTLSRRIGPVDPYFRAHVMGMVPSGDTYSNCEHAAALATRSPAQMTLAAAENCALPEWSVDADARLPFVAGIVFGTELVPFDDPRAGQKVAIDARLFVDYTSRSRFYNELTDASGKLHATEAYLTMGGLLGLHLRASRWFSLEASAALSTRTAHDLSGESLGRRSGRIPSGDLSGATSNPELNPNFDWRYDAPGNRFRISEVSVFDLSVAGVLRF